MQIKPSNQLLAHGMNCLRLKPLRFRKVYGLLSKTCERTTAQPPNPIRASRRELAQIGFEASVSEREDADLPGVTYRDLNKFEQCLLEAT